jgi:Xaa-Pro aminopeptidase
METMQPSLKRGRDNWDQINMPQTEYHERIVEIRKTMKKEGLDVLLVYGRGVNEYGSPCYFSNYMTGTQRAALVAIPKEDEATLIFEGFDRGLPTAKSKTWIKDVRVCNDMGKDCVKYLTEKKLLASTIGFAGLKRLMPYNQMQFLQESTKQGKTIDCDQMIENMRMVKSQCECDQIRRSARIVTRVFESISGGKLPNMSEKMLVSTMDRAAFIDGAEDFRILVAKPKEGKWSFRSPEDGKISAGDTIIIYVALEFERYWSEGIRTFVVSGDSSLVLAKSENIMSLYKQILSSIKPGKSSSQLYKEIVGEMRNNHVDYMPEYGFGQGIGLALHELPMITEEERNQLKAGMCLTLHLAIKDKEMGAFMVGDTVAITKDGAQVLTNNYEQS